MSGLPISTVQSVEDRVNIYAEDARTQFELAYLGYSQEGANAAFNSFTTTDDAQSVITRYTGIKGLRELTPFTGSIDYDSVEGWTVEVDSEARALGYSVDRRSLIADQRTHGILDRLPAALALQADRVKFSNLISLLADNPIWGVDGVALFSDSHEFGDNNITVTVSSTSAPTEDDVIAVIEACRRQWATFTNNKGVPLAEMADDVFPTLFSSTTWMTAFDRVKRQTLVPRSSAAIDANMQSAFQSWATPRLTSSTTLYGFVPTSTAGMDLGQAPALVRTILQPYEMNAGGGPQDNVWRNNKILQVTLHGEEGLGVVNAAKAMKITVTT